MDSIIASYLLELEAQEREEQAAFEAWQATRTATADEAEQEF